MTELGIQQNPQPRPFGWGFFWGPFESYVGPMLGQGPRWTKLGYVGHVWVPKGTYVGLCWGHLRLCWANDGPFGYVGSQVRVLAGWFGGFQHRATKNKIVNHFLLGLPTLPLRKVNFKRSNTSQVCFLFMDVSRYITVALNGSIIQVLKTRGQWVVWTRCHLQEGTPQMPNSIFLLPQWSLSRGASVRRLLQWRNWCTPLWRIPGRHQCQTEKGPGTPILATNGYNGMQGCSLRFTLSFDTPWRNLVSMTPFFCKFAV